MIVGGANRNQWLFWVCQEPYVDFRQRAAVYRFLPQSPLGCTATDLFHLQGDSVTPPGAVFPQGEDLQWDGLLVVGRHAGVEADTKHFG
jgi:hypothetical protein